MMLHISFSELIIYLAVYSILGWICEVVYCSIGYKRFINRGFLNGPYCPMYGIGAMLIQAATYPLPRNLLIIFLSSLLVATVLEYFTGWLMETLFQVRFWDYSNEKFNLKGRICLKNALIFGLLGVIVTYILHPLIEEFIKSLAADTLRLISSAILIVFLIDLLFTLNSMLKLTERLKALKNYLGEIERYDKAKAWFDRHDLKGSFSRLQLLVENGFGNERLNGFLSRLDAIVEKRGWNFRLIKSFPQMKPRGLETALDDLRHIWNERKEQFEKGRKTFWQRTSASITEFGRAAASHAKESAENFASGQGLYKLFWVFAAAGVLGYIVETVFVFITTGVLESRQGVLYGPFSQIYGFGAVLMVIILSPLAKKGDKWLFFGSAAVGGVFEYVSSLVQEGLFGTVSWEYGKETISIGGRTSLTYMLFWGILGFWFIKYLYPHLLGLIGRIPKRHFALFSWILIILLSADIALSAAALSRWSERDSGLPPSNAFEEFFDERYPDEVLQEIYPNMSFVDK